MRTLNQALRKREMASIDKANIIKHKTYLAKVNIKKSCCRFGIQQDKKGLEV